MKKIRFYQSAICPRCHLAGQFLSSLQSGFSEVEIEKVEALSHRSEMRDDGIKQFPALVCEDKSLSGFILTRAKIRGYLASL